MRRDCAISDVIYISYCKQGFVIMSMTIDRMKKAMEKRNASEPSAVREPCYVCKAISTKNSRKGKSHARQSMKDPV